MNIIVPFFILVVFIVLLERHTNTELQTLRNRIAENNNKMISSIDRLIEGIGKDIGNLVARIQKLERKVK